MGWRRSKLTGTLYPGYMGPRRSRIPGQLWPLNFSSGTEVEVYSPLTLSTYLNEFPAPGETVYFGNYSEAEILIGDTKSVGAWIKVEPAQIAYDQHILAKYDYGTLPKIYVGWKLAIDATDHIFFQLQSGLSSWIRVAFNTTIGIDNIWHHVVATYGGTGLAADMNLYIDGVAEAQTKSSGLAVGNTTNDSELGNFASWGGNLNLQGKICHTHMINEETSADVVAKLASIGVPTDLSNTLDYSKLLHWCTYGDGCAFSGPNAYPDLSPLAKHGTPALLEAGDLQGDIPP